MSVNTKMRKICNNIRSRTGSTALLNLDQIAEAIMQIGEATDPATIVYRAIGTTYPPMQNPGEAAFSGYDIDVPNTVADDIHTYIDEVVNGKNTVTKEIMGKDSSGKYDIARYIYANRQQIAWQKQNHPKMYAWKNGEILLYSTSVSPRIGDSLYTVPVVSDKLVNQPGDTAGEVAIPGKAVIIRGQRYSQSGGAFGAEATCASLVIPTEYFYEEALGQAHRHTLVLTNATLHQSRTGYYIGDDKTTFPRGGSMTKNTASNAVLGPSGAADYGQKYAILFLAYDGTQTFENTTVTLDGVSLDVIVSDSAADSIKAAHATTEKVEESVETRPKFTNLKDSCIYRYLERYSMSGGGWKTTGTTQCTSVVIPVPSGKTEVTLRLKNATANGNYTTVYYGTSVDSFIASATDGVELPSDNFKDGEGGLIVPCTKTADAIYISVILDGASASDFADLIVTVDEPIEYETVIEKAEGKVNKPITAVSATNRSRTIGTVEYVRSESDDVEPTVIYTELGDSRNSNATIIQDGITYNRYPLGDLGANRTKLIPVFIYANEHGVDVTRMDTSNANYGKWETKMCALVAARFLRDLASGAQSANPLYKFIQKNCMVIVIPVANPFGFNMPVTGDTNSVNSGYYNYNSVNINRGYDTPGWDNPEMDWNKSPYPGSEIENQYIMNTMVESGAVVAMSLHGLGSWEGYCAHQGQSPDGTDYNRDKLAKVNAFLQANYGYTLRYYDTETDGTPKVAVNMPDTTCKSPSYITQCGAYGGIVEFSPDDVKTAGWKQELKSNVIENAYAQTLNLMAMWLSDYLVQKA